MKQQNTRVGRALQSCDAINGIRRTKTLSEDEHEYAGLGGGEVHKEGPDN